MNQNLSRREVLRASAVAVAAGGLALAACNDGGRKSPGSNSAIPATGATPTPSPDAGPAVHPLIRDGKVMVVPGVYDVLSAKIAERTGFPVVVVTGYGASASHLGEPDFGLLTQTEMRDVVRRITSAVGIAVVVDGDTGYGGPLNVQRLVRELIRMGARGVILEDQRWPKRCGHMRGKEVVDAEEHAAKIRAARDAIGDAPFLLTARTDALETHGLDEAISRARRYKEAGANILFVEGPRSREELRRIGRELPPPLAVNLIEGGRTPLCSLEELAEMGFFSIGFVLSGLYAAARALERTYAEIRKEGTTIGLGDSMFSFDEFNSLIGAETRYAEDERYRP
ncbi:MAG: isocitrate lyase/PEP mutase family protein [Dehalococcoidia bacterium]|nr:isocitrate lyase/PEP mutase family protein [Dehalococcoidia bacterium]